MVIVENQAPCATASENDSFNTIDIAAAMTLTDALCVITAENDIDGSDAENDASNTIGTAATVTLC